MANDKDWTEEIGRKVGVWYSLGPNRTVKKVGEIIKVTPKRFTVSMDDGRIESVFLRSRPWGMSDSTRMEFGKGGREDVSSRCYRDPLPED
jgi:hypothetical protein